jgi:MarR family multiple antibiotic resistance transcriptional regulator
MEFFDALVRYEIALWSAVDQELRRSGPTSLAQLHTLRVLERHGGDARVQDLSDDIGVTVGAASKIADRLERDGLAARGPHPADRRSSLIMLTSDGRQALACAMEVCVSAVSTAVGAESVESVTATLQRLQARLDALGADPA